MQLLPDTYWEIRETKHKGRGLFVKKDIPAGSIIGDYVGTVLRPQDALVDEENFYLMYYHDYAVIAPDLTKPGVHLLNHACVPNAWLYTYKGHTLAFALRQISKGEEITISYLLSPKDTFCKDCVHLCTCGNKQCSKTMHLSKEKYKIWKELNEQWTKKTKKQRIIYGKELPLLSSYPKIPKEYIRQIHLFLEHAK